MSVLCAFLEKYPKFKNVENELYMNALKEVNLKDAGLIMYFKKEPCLNPSGIGQGQLKKLSTKGKDIQEEAQYEYGVNDCIDFTFKSFAKQGVICICEECNKDLAICLLQWLNSIKFMVVINFTSMNIFSEYKNFTVVSWFKNSSSSNKSVNKNCLLNANWFLTQYYYDPIDWFLKI